MENRVTVSICGEEYTFVAEEALLYAEGRLTSARRWTKCSPARRWGRTDAAVLAAANIADELFKEREASEALRRQLKQYIDDAAQAKNEVSELKRGCSNCRTGNNDGAALSRGRTRGAGRRCAERRGRRVYGALAASTRAAAPETSSDEEFLAAVRYCHFVGREGLPDAQHAGPTASARARRDGAGYEPNTAWTRYCCRTGAFTRRCAR